MTFLGGPGGIRTHDLSDANRTLSQLSYRPENYIEIITLSVSVVNNGEERKCQTQENNPAEKLRDFVYAQISVSTS